VIAVIVATALLVAGVTLLLNRIPAVRRDGPDIRARGRCDVRVRAGGCGPPSNACLWEEGQVFWILVDLSGASQNGTQDLAVTAHDAIAA
jgi:hypothetical protein